MAIHPDQIAIINAAFTPSEAEVAHARAVVAAHQVQHHVQARGRTGGGDQRAFVDVQRVQESEGPELNSSYGDCLVSAHARNRSTA